jgi:DNA modification methylase
VTATIHHGDCLEILRGMADDSVDSVVTDPPYGLSFMGKKWDYDVPSEDIWRECLRVLKPGGHLLAFAGTRTQHRMAVRIEDAGFEIRDMIAWVYGSGFPKSRNVCLDMDKMEGHGNRGHRIAVANRHHPDGTLEPNGEQLAAYEPKTDDAREWQGWGTALKPALEPLTVARKPLQSTVAANVLEHGTGAINIDGCRVPTDDKLGGGMVSMGRPKASEGWDRPWMHDPEVTERKKIEAASKVAAAEALGRWPANVIHDGSEEVVGLFPETGKSTGGRIGNAGGGSVPNVPTGTFEAGNPGYGDTGSAARFFYCAKASKADRDEGCEGMEKKLSSSMPGRRDADDMSESKTDNDVTDRFTTERRNHHPTVKPTALMRYLCRLVTPPRGIVLDPFMGSGSTGKAAILEGFQFIGIEREAEYVAIAKARIVKAEAQRGEMLPFQEVAA